MPRGAFAPTVGTFSPSSTGRAPSGPCGTKGAGAVSGGHRPRGDAGRGRGARTGHPRSPPPLRWRERGYDQAQLLAIAAAESLGLRHEEVLARRRDTPVQFRLPAARRRSNVRGAFAVVRPQAVEGKRILLIDDVTTTESTACAEALKKAGAASVDVLAVCHAGTRFSYKA